MASEPDDDDPKIIIWRDLCLSLDIAPLVELGALAPGYHSGFAEMLGDIGPCDAEQYRFWAVMKADTGLLTFEFPVEQAVRVVRRETHLGHRWSFVCPGRRAHMDADCGRLTYRLLLPRTPPGLTVWWGCRACWGVRYRDRDAAARAARRADGVPSLEEIQAGLDRVRRVRDFDRRDRRRARRGK